MVITQWHIAKGSLSAVFTDDLCLWQCQGCNCDRMPKF